MSRTRAHRHYDYWADPRPDWQRPVYGRPTSMKPWTRLYWKAQRSAVRMQLMKGGEPAPTRTRSSVKWDIA